MNALSPLLTRFVETMNAQDSDGFVACFAQDAEVQDEGRTHRGTVEIKAWIEGAFANYQPVLEVAEVSTTDTGAVISGPVSGSFPGSPVVLHYHLTLGDGLITALKCEV
ncbi:MAG: nuclear transport factor 2 family protein [Roseimicrobium sp.]